ncbi:MAG: HlyD family secretion protein [Myxococcota bacterium]|nr:HlyD family secretion protein [Myxococcota bacterium]
MHPYRAPASFAFPLRRLVPPPRRARRVAMAMGVGFVVLLFACALAPWQQAVSGTGRVVAFAPVDRQQPIEAPIEGRVARVYVQEGSHVEAGDPLVDLSDVDPDRLARLEAERALSRERVASYAARLEVIRSRLDSVRATQDGAVRASEARVRVASDRSDAAEQSLTGAEGDLDAAILHLARHRALVEQGLVSRRELEVAIASEIRARAGRDSARAQRDAAQNETLGARAALEQARAARRAELESAEAALRSAETDLQSAESALLRLETSLSRQTSQRVLAPRSGSVLRVSIRQGGELVRPGDVLMVLVPDTADRAVEIWVDGNDAALIQAGRHVRLQFEGWPAVQFVGWPSVAVGTFGGEVAFVDATDDGQGDFRVLVVPDADDEPWPEPRFLRQGVRANGWVMLEQVRLGFEVWRQINGFPPSMQRPPSSGPSGASSYGSSSYGGSGSYGGGEEGQGYGD